MTPFLMQVLVICGLISNAITEGFIFGQVAGMVDDLMQPDAPMHFTDSEISWIASAFFISTFFGSIASGYLSDRIGRRLSISVLSSPIIIYWIILYYAQSITVLIIGRVIVGVSFGGAFIITSMATGEFTSPKSRSMSISIIMCISPALGVGIGHVLSTFMNWRYVALLGTVPALFATILPLFWVESPSWLASKGRYDECEKAFRALHGTRTDSDKELALLLKVEKSKEIKIKFSDAIRQKRFCNVTILSFVISFYTAASGRHFLPLFAITIIKEITNSSDIVLYTFLVEIFTIFGTMLSIVASKMCNMRPLIIVVGLISSMVMLLISASMYFKPGDISYMSWVNISLLSLYFVLTNAGPYPVIFAILGEIFPLDLKAFCIPLTICSTSVLGFLSVKMAALLFSVLGYHGTFLLHGIFQILCLFMFWLRLPETKGRTLQEIELFFKNNTFENIDDLLSDQKIPLKVEC